MENGGAVDGRLYPANAHDMGAFRKPEDPPQGGRLPLPGLIDTAGQHSAYGPNSIDLGPGTTSGAGGAVSADAGGADSSEIADGKRRKRPGGRTSGEKGKGLRHFSLKVCEKVESKGRTTYNEVADELVAEITGPDRALLPQDQQQYDEKNIRRRVYDALNVLMAMDIISKEKKEIKWKGLPPSSGSHEILEVEREKTLARLEKKRASHLELQEQVAAIERLIRRNETSYQNGGTAPGSGVGLPFILVQTRPQATVEVEISEDMQLVHFDFGSTPFELHDDSFVLRAMGLANAPLDDVFPPNGNGAILTSPSGPGPQGQLMQQLPDGSVALAATTSAPQTSLGSGFPQGLSQMQSPGYSPLTRSASAGQHQQMQQMAQPAAPLPYGAILAPAQQGVGSAPFAGALPQLPMGQAPMGLPGSQAQLLPGHLQQQAQQQENLHQQGPNGQMYYQTGQFTGPGPQVMSGGSFPSYGGFQNPSAPGQNQQGQPGQAMPYGTQYSGSFNNPGMGGAQFQQPAQVQQQLQPGGLQQQQQQQQQPMFVQIPAYEQQHSRPMGGGPIPYSVHQPGSQPYSIPSEQMGVAYQQQQQQQQQVLGNPAQVAQPPVSSFPQPGAGPQAFYQQAS